VFTLGHEMTVRVMSRGGPFGITEKSSDRIGGRSNFGTDGDLSLFLLDDGRI
jgi:hypothetical protein